MSQESVVEQQNSSSLTLPRTKKYNNILTRIVKARLWRQNKNWLAIICGETGSGKTYGAMNLAETLDPNFSIDKVVFSAEEFIELLNSGKLKKGSCVVFDEAGVGLPKREWYTIANKLINYVLQTFRHENLAVIFTTPSFDFIDVDARKLFHTYIQTTKIDYKTELIHTKLFVIQYNPRYGKIYAKYFRINGVKINPFCIGKPSKKIIDKYEFKKKEFTTKLKKDALIILKKTKEIKQEKVVVTDFEIAKDILKSKSKLKRITKFWRGKNIIDRYVLQSLYKISEPKSIRVKKMLEQQLYKKD